MAKLSVIVGALKSAIDIRDARIGEMTDMLTTLTERAESALDERQQEIAAATNQVHDLQRARATLQAELEQERRKASNAQQELQSLTAASTGNFTQLQQQLHGEQQRSQELQTRLKDLTDELSDAGQREDQLRLMTAEFEEMLEAERSKTSHALQDLQSNATHLHQEQQRSEDLQRRLDETMDKLQESTRREVELRSLLEECQEMVRVERRKMLEIQTHESQLAELVSQQRQQILDLQGSELALETFTHMEVEEPLQREIMQLKSHIVEAEEKHRFTIGKLEDALRESHQRCLDLQKALHDVRLRSADVSMSLVDRAEQASRTAQQTGSDLIRTVASQFVQKLLSECTMQLLDDDLYLAETRAKKQQKPPAAADVSLTRSVAAQCAARVCGYAIGHHLTASLSANVDAASASHPHHMSEFHAQLHTALSARDSANVKCAALERQVDDLFVQLQSRAVELEQARKTIEKMRVELANAHDDVHEHRSVLVNKVSDSKALEQQNAQLTNRNKKLGTEVSQAKHALSEKVWQRRRS